MSASERDAPVQQPCGGVSMRGLFGVVCGGRRGVQAASGADAGGAACGGAAAQSCVSAPLEGRYFVCGWVGLVAPRGGAADVHSPAP